ncbi:MAG TPA: hypothetical protein VMB78_03625 [Dissulfurispiraceae bacterium]|nr:hypothetical protein [Dissulfurispiraceae bacterium]
MKSKLGDALLSIISNRQTGQLAITLKGIGQHCNIFFSDGKISNIVCGNQPGKSFLDLPGHGEISECLFIPNTAMKQPPEEKTRLNETGRALEL